MRYLVLLQLPCCDNLKYQKLVYVSYCFYLEEVLKSKTFIKLLKMNTFAGSAFY